MESFEHEAHASYLLKESRTHGLVSALIGLCVIPFFIWMDFAVIAQPSFLGARLIGLTIAVAGLALILALPPSSRILPLVHGLILGAYLTMLYMMTGLVWFSPRYTEHDLLMVLDSLGVVSFACLFLASGIRLWVPLVIWLPFLILVTIIAATGHLVTHDWSPFSNVVLVNIVVTILSIMQSGGETRAFHSRMLAGTRLRQIEALLHASTESVFLMEPAGTIVLCNAAFAERLGTTVEAVTGSNVYDLLSPELAFERRKHADEALAKKTRVQFEDVRDSWCLEHTIQPVVEDDGSIRYLAVFAKDVTARHMKEERLLHQALHDPLTGLPNRRSFRQRLGQSIGRARRGVTSSLAFVDLDHFKEVNDLLGHEQGDRVLEEISAVLKTGARENDEVFRLGGDEFVIILEGIDLEGARSAAERLRILVEARRLGVPDQPVTLSAGCILIAGNLSVDQILNLADGAMYQAKEGGRNRVQVAE